MSTGKKANLWGGRFTEKASTIAQQLSESISFDYKLSEFDIQASIAHACMLGHQKILTSEQVSNIIKGLQQVQEELQQNKIEFDIALEDIHTHVEQRLTELIGDDGKRLHTARSRNDQVAVDTHLLLKDAITRQKVLLKELLNTIIQEAKKNQNSIWAGYTHTQIAQPVLLGHYLMSWFFKFKRDYDLLNFALNECDQNPLGAAAMAGANYPIDREFTAEQLGFSKVYENSMDAVSNRDYQLSYHFFAARLFIHISRISEDFIIYNSAEFKYIHMTDKVTTGSSIMPQKKNPDISELLRGKTARVVGNLQALLMNLKSLPLTYNRDLQEDKIYLFDTIEQVNMGILGLTEVLQNTEYDSSAVIKNLKKGFAQATDIADFLVREYGTPFRTAHEISGSLVLYCEQNQKTLDQLTPEEIAKIIPAEYNLPADILSIENCIESKQGTGATSSKELSKQIDGAGAILKSL